MTGPHELLAPIVKAHQFLVGFATALSCLAVTRVSCCDADCRAMRVAMGHWYAPVRPLLAPSQTFTVPSNLQRAVAFGLENESTFYKCASSNALHPLRSHRLSRSVPSAVNARWRGRSCGSSP
jgi:hypothetical protein